MRKYNYFPTLLITFFILFNFSFQKLLAQEEKEKENFIGLYIPRGLTKTSENLTPGYVLFASPNSSLVYLMDREGQIVHSWKGNYEILNAYLNNDGSLTLQAIDPDFPIFDGGGMAGRIQKISWDSKMLWDFEYANEKHLAHHDIAVLPNGNVLTIAWEARSLEEVIAAGRNPESIPKAGFWTSTIVEIEPIDETHGNVVWEWRIWDHLIQDFDKEKDNYGDVAVHPELMDFNVLKKLPKPIQQDSLDILKAKGEFGRNATIDNGGSDLYHLNAVNYNEELDQIVFSSPHLSEIFIIDHSTTTEEAASHEGGKRGHGGDFLFRWGNPQNYRQGDSTAQQSFGQHDVRWIDNGHPGEGQLMFFNNNVPLVKAKKAYSSIYQIKLPADEQGHYLIMEKKRFGPKEVEWKYIAKDTISFHGPYVSGAQRMKNGNTFINEGPKGRFFEVTPEGEIVWEYLNQYRGNILKPNGDSNFIPDWVYSNFRSNFIPSDHPALKDKNLVPLDPQPAIFKMPPKKEVKKVE